jgi:hypothetical protein
MRGDDIESLLMSGDEQGGRIGTSGHGDQHSIARSDQSRSAKSEDEWFVNVGEQHGGAGWTRTSDNAIMSRALYHLSYGTAGRRRAHKAHSSRKSYRAACARAFSFRFLVRRFASATRFLLFTALQITKKAGEPGSGMTST